MKQKSIGRLESTHIEFHCTGKAFIIIGSINLQSIKMRCQNREAILLFEEFQQADTKSLTILWRSSFTDFIYDDKGIACCLIGDVLNSQKVRGECRKIIHDGLIVSAEEIDFVDIGYLAFDEARYHESKLIHHDGKSHCLDEDGFTAGVRSGDEKYLCFLVSQGDGIGDDMTCLQKGMEKFLQGKFTIRKLGYAAIIGIAIFHGTQITVKHHQDFVIPLQVFDLLVCLG